jgi:hypothetical protein
MSPYPTTYEEHGRIPEKSDYRAGLLRLAVVLGINESAAISMWSP